MQTYPAASYSTRPSAAGTPVTNSRDTLGGVPGQPRGVLRQREGGYYYYYHYHYY